MRDRSLMGRVAALGAATLALGATPAWADPVTISAPPKIMFYVENGENIAGTWQDVSGGLTRYEVIFDAIKHVLYNAPNEMEIGGMFTKFSGSTFGKFSAIQADRSDFVTAMGLFVPNTAPIAFQTNTQWVTWGQSYMNAIQDYFTLTCDAASEGCTDWDQGPFTNDCSEVHVIALGFSVGFQDSFIVSPYSDTYTGDWTSPTSAKTYLDNLANYAATTDLRSDRTGTQRIITHAVLVDGLTASSDAEGLFMQTAVAGGGLYFEALQPAEVANSIWAIINDAFQGYYARSGPVVSASLSHLFQGFFEVVGGEPLFKGHLQAYHLNDDPTDSAYGQIITGPGSDGELWDAGQILASRIAQHAEENSTDPTVYDYSNQRGVYTNYANSGFPYDSTPAALESFDYTGVTDGAGNDGDLVDLLVPQQAYDITLCDALTYDFDGDCDVDRDDAQLVVDFLRGVPDSPYGNFGGAGSFNRGNWKLGSINHSIVEYVPADPQILTDRSDFYNFLQNISQLASMVYVAANDGALHAFNVSDIETDDSTDPSGGWEWWAYIPRHMLNYNADAVWGEDEQRAIDQKLYGETFTNDGSLNMEYVWMDGICNGLPNGDASYCDQASSDGIRAENGSEWHRILVASMGFASRHVYALDISNPSNPRFLWEVPDGTDGEDTADNDTVAQWGRGMSLSRPTVGVVYDTSGATAEARWVAFWGAGAPFVSASDRGTQYYVHPNLFMVDVLKPFGGGALDTTGYPAPVASADSSLIATNDDGDTQEEYDIDTNVPHFGAAGALYGSPAAVDVDGDGGIDVVYIGDRAGQMYKYVMNTTDLDDPTSCLFSTPPGTDDAPSNQWNLYYRPAVTFDLEGRLLLFYGTGSPYNTLDENATGYFYMMWDTDPFGCTEGSAAPCDDDGVLALGTGEKFVGTPIAAAGVVYFTTYQADSDPCILGNGYLYGISMTTCDGALTDYDGDSYTVEDDTRIELDGIPSEVSFANDSIYVSTTIPGSNPDVLDPIHVGQSGSQMNRFNFANWRNVF